MARQSAISKPTEERWESILEDFLNLKRASGLSKRTLFDYKEILGLFRRRQPSCLREPRTAVQEFMANSMSPSTFNKRMAHLKAFYSWLIEEEICPPPNPFKDIKRRRESSRIVSMPEDTMKNLITLCDATTYPGLRDKALILLQLDTGIRPGEALALLPGDLDLRGLSVNVPAAIAKTRSPRTLPISACTAKTIRKLLSARPLAWKETTPVFCGHDGLPFIGTSWTRRLSLYSKSLGVKVTPYHLRHAFAIQFLRNGGNVFSLQRILGHADLTMTKRYLALTQTDVANDHAGASPMAKLFPERHRAFKLA